MIYYILHDVPFPYQNLHNSQHSWEAEYVVYTQKHKMLKFKRILRSSCQASFSLQIRKLKAREAVSALGHTEEMWAWSNGRDEKLHHRTNKLVVIRIEVVLFGILFIFQDFFSQAKLLFILKLFIYYIWLRQYICKEDEFLSSSHCVNRNFRNYITEICEVTNCYLFVICGSDRFSFLCSDDVRIIESLMFFQEPLQINDKRQCKM